MKKINATLQVQVALLILFLLPLAAAQAEKILAVEFTLSSHGNVELTDIRMYEGQYDSSPEVTDYSIVLLSDTGDILHTTYFTAEFEAWPDPETVTQLGGFPGQDIGELGPIALDKIELFVRVPYMTEATKFQIRKSGNVLFEYSINLCNNDGDCQVVAGENFLSCQDDCPSGGSDEYCDEIYDNKCDPDCKLQAREVMDPDCTCGNGICDAREDYYSCSQDCGKPPMNRLMQLIIYAAGGLLLIIILIILLIVFLVKKRKKSK